MLICARLSTPKEVREWRNTLEEAVGRIPDGGTFKLLVDLRGYEASEDPVAHQEMRAVVPLLLARHGLRTAVLELFPEAKVEIRTERGVRCIAAAYVHHDVNKMAAYNEQLAPSNERFFTDREEAERWLTNIRS